MHPIVQAQPLTLGTNQEHTTLSAPMGRRPHRLACRPCKTWAI